MGRGEKVRKKYSLILVLFIMTAVLTGFTGTALAAETSPAGIQPVSPTEFAGKIDSAAKSAYKTAEPVVDTIASLVFSCTGIAAFFVLFAGMALLKRVIASLLTAGFGLLVYYGTPLFVGVIKGIALKIVS